MTTGRDWVCLASRDALTPSPTLLSVASSCSRSDGFSLLFSWLLVWWVFFARGRGLAMLQCFCTSAKVHLQKMDLSLRYFL